MKNHASGVLTFESAKAKDAIKGIRALSPATADDSEADVVVIDEETGRLYIIELKSTAAADTVVSTLTAMRQHEELQRSAVTRLIGDLLPPDLPALSKGVLRQVERNTAVLARISREFGLFDGTQLHELARSKSTNVWSTASRWAKDRSVFFVEVESKRLYPGFQFDLDSGAPKPVISRVLEAQGDDVTGWSLAVWFVSANSRLGGQRPVDLLASHPDEVVAAARSEALEFIL